MKIKNKKIKLIFVSFGILALISTPVIIIGSIYIYNNLKISPELTELNQFYNTNSGIIFSKFNFIISQPEKTSEGKSLVQNLQNTNIILKNKDYLKNYSYNIEILKIYPNTVEQNFSFDYKIFSISHSSISIVKRSEIYSSFINSYNEEENFSK